jgi:hypothetical protein
MNQYSLQNLNICFDQAKALIEFFDLNLVIRCK